jgi:hypothetical protein
MCLTAVTTMLIYGITETVVKKISGHSPARKAYYRFVNFVQPYIDQEIKYILTPIKLIK